VVRGRRHDRRGHLVYGSASIDRDKREALDCEQTIEECRKLASEDAGPFKGPNFWRDTIFVVQPIVIVERQGDYHYVEAVGYRAIDSTPVREPRSVVTLIR